MDFVNSLRRRHRGFVVFSTIVLIWLLFFSGKILFHLLWPESKTYATHLTREWGLGSVFAALWVYWFCTVLGYLRHRSRHIGFERSIQTCLMALLDENRLTRARTKMVCVLLGIVVLMVPVLIHQLQAVGKAGKEIDSMLVIVPVVVGGIILGLVFHYRRTLLSEKFRIESLLESNK